MNIFKTILLRFRVSNYRYHKQQYHLFVVKPAKLGCWIPGEYFICTHDYEVSRKKLKRSLTEIK